MKKKLENLLSIKDTYSIWDVSSPSPDKNQLGSPKLSTPILSPSETISDLVDTEIFRFLRKFLIRKIIWNFSGKNKKMMYLLKMMESGLEVLLHI